MSISAFKNEKAAIRFGTAYERALNELWPSPRTALDIPTAFGTTRAYRTGPPGGEPIVLLPAAGGNALMWHAYIDQLSRHHTVIAMDTIGEPGASLQTAPINDGRDAAAWLDEVLASQNVTAGHIVGCSYGGWVALNHHIHHPGRTAALTLIDPAGFAAVGWRFYRWVIAGGLAGMAPRPLRPRLARMVHNSTILDAELMRLVRASMGFRRALPAPPVFSDDELNRVSAPALFLLGADSAIHDSRAVSRRLDSLMPSARIEIVPDAGHALSTDQTDLVLERILKPAA